MPAMCCRLANAVPRRGAFTLFEMVLVMAVIVILMGIAVPLLLNHLHDDTKVQAAVDTVKARWADCRTHAIEEGQMYRFAVIPNSGKFRVEPCDAMGQPILAAENMDAEAVGFVMEDTLPPGVRFGTKDMAVNPDGPEADGGEYVPIAIFLPDGTAQSDVEVTFGGAGSVTTLRLSSLTGATSVIRVYQDSK